MAKSELAAALNAGKTITLQGKKFLRKPLSLNDMVAMEEEFGDVDAAMKTLKGVRKALWLMVKKSHPDMTLEQAGELLDTNTVRDVGKIFSDEEDTNAKNA